MSETVRRYFPRKKKKHLFLNNISRKLKIDTEHMFGSKPRIEVIESARHRVFVIDGRPLVAESEDELFPTLLFQDFLSRLPKIIVDMGAVPYVCNGADVMAPGIVEIRRDFEGKDLVVIMDVKNRKPIAIARSLFDSKTGKTVKKGRMFKNLHHVGDDIWTIIKKPWGNKRVKT
ncbi:MAG: DUF1947 domain-containing protein [Candidatus Bathyarchaeota archaeon]|nr:DUF1947 domain-containing protein [Candidatus Bathyarchaeota archaeon]